MKKMRFLAFMLSVAFLATTFTSCSSDDDDILDNFTYVIVKPEENPIVGEEFTVTYTVTSIENIEKIEIFYDNEPVYTVEKKELAAKKIHTDDFKFTADEAGTYKFSLIIEDRKGKTDKKDFEVTVVSETTALGEWSEEIRIKRPASGDYKADNDDINLKWIDNVTKGDLAFAAINVATISGSAVLVDNADFETVESLEEAYEAGEKVSTFVIKTDGKYEAVNYITIVGDDYVLVKTSTKATLNGGDNDAYFQYKK